MPPIGAITSPTSSQYSLSLRSSLACSCATLTYVVCPPPPTPCPSPPPPPSRLPPPPPPSPSHRHWCVLACGTYAACPAGACLGPSVCQHQTDSCQTRTYTLQLLAVRELTLHRTLLPPSVTLPLHMFASCRLVTSASNISMSDTCLVKTCTFTLLF